MGMLHGLFGRASSVDLEQVSKEYGPLLIDGEHVVSAYKLVRDTFVFTNLRIILADKQGMTGRKTDFMTIPYESIVRFSKESTGTMDLDAELKIWIRGESMPIVKEFHKNDNVNDVYRILSMAVLKS